MALTLEWQHRVDNWRNELRRHFYRPLGALALSGFTTRGHLTAEEALKGRFKPMPPGTRWGAKWEYGWFKGQVVLPQEAAGRPQKDGEENLGSGCPRGEYQVKYPPMRL